MAQNSNAHFNMAFQITRIVILILISLKLCKGMQIQPVYMEKNSQICVEMSKKPYFDINIITGKPWRIYYTWNVDIGTKCLDMVVKNATSSTVNRIYNDMHDYLQTQPEWDAATLYIRMGMANHELLMCADQGAEGYFLGVPNVVKTGNIIPVRQSVPLLKFFLKLVHHGRYLLMMDCHIGVPSLLSRERPPYRAEVHSVAMSLNLGDGHHACLADRRKDELQSNVK